MGGTLLILCPGSQYDEVWTPELENVGYIVLYAEESNQALVHVRTGDVDCVLISIANDTQECVSEFVSLLGLELNAPPFVLVSSSPAAPTVSAKLGAMAFVAKPCGASELEPILARMSVRPVQKMLQSIK